MEVPLQLTACVCTRNRPVMLRRAIASLVEQGPPPWEILVIDNAPRDRETWRVVDSFSNVRYVAEPTPGLDFARNRALAEARGDVVAFLDDDAVADAGWADAFLEAFQRHPEVLACTGRVEALEESTPGARLVEANGGYSRGLHPIRLPGDARRPLHGRRAPLIAWSASVGNGTSMALRRRAALELGGFDEALDLGPELPGGGDLDLFWRILKGGGELLYEPAALAWHEHRAGTSEALKQIAGHQRAFVAMLVKSVLEARGNERWPVAGYLAWRLCKPSARLVRRIVGADPLPLRGLAAMQYAAVSGLWAYPLARREAKRRKAAREGSSGEPAARSAGSSSDVESPGSGRPTPGPGHAGRGPDGS